MRAKTAAALVLASLTTFYAIAHPVDRVSWQWTNTTCTCVEYCEKIVDGPMAANGDMGIAIGGAYRGHDVCFRRFVRLTNFFALLHQTRSGDSSSLWGRTTSGDSQGSSSGIHHLITSRLVRNDVGFDVPKRSLLLHVQVKSRFRSLQLATFRKRPSPAPRISPRPSLRVLFSTLMAMACASVKWRWQPANRVHGPTQT